MNTTINPKILGKDVKLLENTDQKYPQICQIQEYSGKIIDEIKLPGKSFSVIRIMGK